MTIFKNNGRNWEWPLLVDTFNNEILAHQATPAQGSTKLYYHRGEQHNILRSVPRVGTPADNAIIEAINGWIKEKLFPDFGSATAKDVPELLDEYVYYYNNERPAAALGYKSSVQHKTEPGF